MPAGGKLTIETHNVYLDEAYERGHQSASEGSYVLLAVSDTGAGMDEEARAHAFEPFFTTKPTGEGTGLGLATCYGIVKQHGGNIWLYSEPGQGATFKIYLPRVDEPVAPAPAPAETGGMPQGAEVVLLVEDEAAVRLLAARVLQEQGYTVLEAANGPEALRLAEAWAPAAIQLLVTDMVMPQMSGKVVAEQLLMRYPELKVLFISGYTDSAIVHQGRLDAGVAFLHKPFTPARLARKVREVLDA
jgi:CheY-like chemotaxis protein